MSTSESLIKMTRPANADLSTKQYYAVKAVSGGKVDLCSATTDKAVGILQDKPAAADRAAQVGIVGVSKAVAGAAISVGALVAPMASGKIQTAVTTQYCIGIALTAASADGDTIEIKLGAPGLI